MNSFSTGAAENSGFSNIQLPIVSKSGTGRRCAATSESIRGQLVSSPKKPVEICLLEISTNEVKSLVRSSHLRIMLFCGNGGMAAPAFGNVIRSFFRKSENSEYLPTIEQMDQGNKE